MKLVCFSLLQSAEYPQAFICIRMTITGRTIIIVFFLLMDNASNVDNTFGAGHLTVAPCVSVNLIALRKINKEISIYSSIFDINLD